MPPNQVQSPIGVQFLRTSQAGQQVGGLDKPIRTREKYGTDEPTANRSVNATIPVQNAVQSGMMPMNAAPQSQPHPCSRDAAHVPGAYGRGHAPAEHDVRDGPHVDAVLHESCRFVLHLRLSAIGLVPQRLHDERAVCLSF